MRRDVGSCFGGAHWRGLPHLTSSKADPDLTGILNQVHGVVRPTEPGPEFRSGPVDRGTRWWYNSLSQISRKLLISLKIA
jgi:hypothetical protein